MSDSLYRGHWFPREIISECAWLYFRFGVSFRDVEELMAARGVLVSYETVRYWCHKFGKQYADGLRRRRARSGNKWHLDEVFLKINGVTHYLWRAVDQNGIVSIFWFYRSGIGLPQSRFFSRLLRAIGRKPPVIITDKLRSYGAAKRVVMPGPNSLSKCACSSKSKTLILGPGDQIPNIIPAGPPRAIQHVPRPLDTWAGATTISSRPLNLAHRRRATGNCLRTTPVTTVPGSILMS